MLFVYVTLSDSEGSRFLVVVMLRFAQHDMQIISKTVEDIHDRNSGTHPVFSLRHQYL